MFMKIISKFSLVSLITASTALAELDARSLAQVGDGQIQISRFALRWANSIVNEETSSATCHDKIVVIPNDQNAFRSLLILNSDGQLVCDSFNSVRFYRPDLSDRDYVIDGYRAVGEKINHVVVGKQSGLTFIPISAVRPDGGLSVVTVIPEALIPPQVFCAACGALVLLDRQVIASSSQFSTLNEDIASRVNFHGSYGNIDVQLRGMIINVSWYRSQQFENLIYVTYHGTGVNDEKNQ